MRPERHAQSVDHDTTPSPADETSDELGRERAVRTYYRSLDAGDYDALAAVLAPSFVQVRPDRTFEGRDAFVEFMRDDRPDRETTHELAAVYRTEAGDEWAARGTLVSDDGGRLFDFVDAFAFDGDAVTRVETFVRE
jgi:ketosteroid isomerase-like protein